MNTRFTTGLALVSVSISTLMLASPAGANLYLVGAYLFGANSVGATTNTNYQYDTNVNNADLALLVNGSGKNLSLLLTPGVNNFTLTVPQNFALSNNGDLGLYFSATNTPFNPIVPAVAPNLLVSRNVNGATAFFTPAAGTTINNYRYGNTALANGVSTFTLGTNTVTVSSYIITSNPLGLLSLTVDTITPETSTTPEPGTLALLSGLSVCGGLCAQRRRRRQRLPK
jgi:hypothetical protein